MISSMPNKTLKENNKRIAKNALILSIRMLLTMIISLYTVRLLLNVLGVVDYGVYNVVGGIVVMISILSNTLGAASQRFFAIEIGRDNLLQLKRTFSLSLTIYIILTLIVLLLAETVGFWFLNAKMVIPLERIDAANWIFQFSIFSFIFNILSIPYASVIIAREDMTVFALISVIDVVFKLVIVYILTICVIDKLKLYAVLILVETIIITLLNIIICRRKYNESRFQIYWDKGLFKTLISFSSWNLFGATASVLNSQGVNILLNLFFGPVVNAARGIAYQVSSAVNQFVMNLQTSVNPQITKYYAVNDKKQMMFLVLKSSKFSYFLFFILSMPVLLETNYILELWLKKVPDYVVLFTRLVIINALIDSLSYSLQTVALATGEIKRYQIIVGGMMLLNLPISYMFLRLGFAPEVTIYVSIMISVVCLFLRTWILKKIISFSFRDFFRLVILVITIVSIVAQIIPMCIILQMESSLIRFILICSTSVMSSLISIYFLGINVNERRYVNEFIYKRIKTIK